MVDPDLRLKVGMGGGHPHTEIRREGGPVSKKKVFGPSGLSFWPKNKGGKAGPLAPPLDPPLTTTEG